MGFRLLDCDDAIVFFDCDSLSLRRLYVADRYRVSNALIAWTNGIVRDRRYRNGHAFSGDRNHSDLATTRLRLESLGCVSCGVQCDAGWLAAFTVSMQPEWPPLIQTFPRRSVRVIRCRIRFKKYVSCVKPFGSRVSRFNHSGGEAANVGDRGFAFLWLFAYRHHLPYNS